MRPDRWSRRVTRPTSASISGTRTASRRLQPPCARASPGSCSRPNRRAAASCCSICCARMESRPGSSPAGTSFSRRDAELAVTVAPLVIGCRAAPIRPITIYAEEQLFGERARQERRRRRADRDPARIIQQLADLRPGAPVVHEDYGVGRYRGLTTMETGGMTAEFLRARVCRRRQAVRARAGARARQPLHRRAGGNRAAAQARRRSMAEGAAACRGKHPRRGRGTARRLLAARCASGLRVPGRRAAAASLRAALPVRGDRRSAGGDPPGGRRSSGAPADGSRGLRRRGLRQDRGGAARRFRRRPGRQAGRRARAHDAARAAALPDIRRPLRRLAGQGRAPVAIPGRRAIEGDARRTRRTDRSTSSSARTDCCSRGCGSRTWDS